MNTVLSRVDEATTPVSIGDADHYTEDPARPGRQPTRFDDDQDYETFKPAIRVNDGGHVCHVTSVSAYRLHQLVKSGRVRLDPLLRGRKGRRQQKGDVRDEERIAEWTRGLLSEQKPFLGQLTWNVCPERGGMLEYNPQARTLKIAGIIDVPDSVRRHAALVEAYDAIERGGNFDPRYRVSICVHNLGLEEETRLFKELNQPND